MSREWKKKIIVDDHKGHSNKRGTVTFATSGKDSRTTQVFINTSHNKRLDAMGFSPVGEVVEGMDVVDKFYSGYGEGAPNGKGPAQRKIEKEGNAYLEDSFPKLTFITKVKFTN